jgi:hypothetical protein
MPISLGEWFLTHWNDHVKQRTNPDISKRPLECTVSPGEILFVSFVQPFSTLFVMLHQY